MCEIRLSAAAWAFPVARSAFEIIALGREELVDREFDPAEEFARIVFG
jgi:hypothetical protein